MPIRNHHSNFILPLLFVTGLVTAATTGCQAPVTTSSSSFDQITGNGSYVPSELLERPLSGPIEGMSTGCAHCDQHPAIVCETPIGQEFRPADEYLCDGGDRFPPARATKKKDNQPGLDLEDTVAQYERPNGKRETVASSRACVYAPRFAAVRRVTNVTAAELHELPLRSEERLTSIGQQLNLPANNVAQPVATVRNVRNLKVGAIEDGNRGRTVDDVDQLRSFRLKLLPYENLRIVRTGTYHSGERVRLAQAAFAAQTWTAIEAVQVTYDGIEASTLARTRGPQETYEYGPADGKARLRVVKVASTDEAHPGDVVHFTIRFDNVGTEPLSSVILSDNLTTRLEYVADSQECTREAQFSSKENIGQSLLLRWELKEPLDVGQGGVIRFQCRVR